MFSVSIPTPLPNLIFVDFAAVSGAEIEEEDEPVLGELDHRVLPGDGGVLERRVRPRVSAKQVVWLAVQGNCPHDATSLQNLKWK